MARPGRYAHLRDARAGQLQPVTPQMPLQRGEFCYYPGPGRILKERNLRPYQESGVRYALRGFIVDKEGTLALTNGGAAGPRRHHRDSPRDDPGD
jgi:hypothetical protein